MWCFLGLCNIVLVVAILPGFGFWITIVCGFWMFAVCWRLLRVLLALDFGREVGV